MDSLSSATTVLTAMITPAVLISACGSMILSTSTRLGRVVDRVRGLSEKLEEISNRHEANDLAKERQAAIYDQLDKLTSRAQAATALHGYVLSLAGRFRRHQRRHWRGRHLQLSSLHFGAGNLRLDRRAVPFLRQYAFDLRGAAGAQHHSCGDGFHLAPFAEGRACRDCRRS